MPKKFIRSFSYAQEGAKHILRTQRNIWVHLFFGFVALGIALWLKVQPTEMAVLSLTISFVIAAEMFNTVIEEIVNLVKPEKHPMAALIKNIAAAAVLVSAIGSIVVGLLIFVPRIFRWQT